MSKPWTSHDEKRVNLMTEAPAVRFRFKKNRPAGSDSDPIEWHLRQNSRSFLVGTELLVRKALSDVLNLGGNCAQLFQTGEGI